MTLVDSLRRQRDAAISKTEGLPGSVGRAIDPVLGYSLVGLLRHLEDVEAFWIRHIFLGEPARVDGQDDNFVVPETLGYPELVERYRAAGTFTDAVALSHDMSQGSTRQRRNATVTLRWILVHLIEETARHCGHLDILRQRIDGRTGSR